MRVHAIVGGILQVGKHNEGFEDKPCPILAHYACFILSTHDSSYFA